MNEKILITGATGSTGGHAIAELLQRNIPIRAMVHRLDERAERLSAQGVEIIQGDLSDFNEVYEALKGISAAYFVYPIQSPGIVESTAYFAQAAAERGVKAIVNMSQITARREAPSRATRDHWIAERLLDRSGIPVTHLRPTFFTEWLMYHSKGIREDDVLPLPFGTGRHAPIAAEDQGRLIAAILTSPAEHAGKTYPLFGPVEYDIEQIVEILSTVMGRKITYLPMEIEAFKTVMREREFTPHLIQHISAVAQDCRDGLFAGTNDIVERITGRKPLPVVDYITKNRALFESPARQPK